MKALRIDFAPRSLRRTLFHLHPAVLVAAVAGLLLCASAALSGWQLLQRQHEREQQLGQRRARQADLFKAAAAPVATVAIPEQQATFVNAAILQLNLPWRALQDAVAAATPQNVALLALEPDARKHVLKLTAETRNSDDMVGYIEQLKEQDLFSSVVLTRHEINDQDANRPLRFQIEAEWRVQ